MPEDNKNLPFKAISSKKKSDNLHFCNRAEVERVFCISDRKITYLINKGVVSRGNHRGYSLKNIAELSIAESTQPYGIKTTIAVVNAIRKLPMEDYLEHFLVLTPQNPVSSNFEIDIVEAGDIHCRIGINRCDPIVLCIDSVNDRIRDAVAKIKENRGPYK